MSTPIFRPTRDYSTLWLWLGVAFLLATIAVLSSGCSSPGKVGFRQLQAENVAEKRVMKAAAVHVSNIGRHTDRALQLTDDLSHTRLDPAQTKELDEIRVELNAVKTENTGLTKQLLAAQDIIIQRDATIAQTQAEVKAAASEKFWHEVKIGAICLLIGLLLGSVLIWIFRKTIQVGVIAAEAEVPGLAKL